MKKTKRRSKLLTLDCGQCSSCCRDIQVDVTDADIRRLIQYTGIPADQLVRLYSPADTEDTEESDWIRLSYGKRAMELNKKRNGDCLFLSEENACTAYEARPMTCRIFPICVVSDERNTIVDLETSDVITDKTIRCKRTQGNGRSYTSFMATARQALNEQKAFQKRLAEWNRTPASGSKNDFLRFLRLTTSAARPR